ncbi:MAG TPA: stage IV sporulation protein A [Bacillota bacterium]|jgi:stage IV sporulation protein A|nr:stage IV sporulation protein A [Peptococcaceae bacterium MAG4]NLW38136.1 stage IV sporulation protein A [Peptococcaceae bacterium]HPZ43031.1 stage IV sporulation protein A [Bacillota bacterium]HQD75560.1 stage IV sporulation protein A [Bacillota bacterium]HUM57825.1 stage IV sporulation protein A [Bacillota bacterium]
MEKTDIFRDIAERTGGDLYLGVVGGVRTGKSTFIRRFMELMVLPNMKNVHDRERTKDELPQGAAGRTVMTTEPKFIPNEAVEIQITPNLTVRLRMVDCVGYRVEGALGYEEDDGPRMVSTPWFEEPIPFQEAAEIGTRKVISEHSTMGLVMTTDGSITEIDRESYIDAEERVIEEMKDINRPFLVLLNSTNAEGEEAQQLAAELTEKYDVPVLPINCAQMTQADILNILEKLLYEFPVNEVNISLPPWVEELDFKHWLRQKFEDSVRETVKNVRRLRDVNGAVESLAEYEFVDQVSLHSLDMGTGSASIGITSDPALFYQVLSEQSGFNIEGERELFRLVKELSVAKREYDKVAHALSEVRDTGYGVVTPSLDELVLEEPELIRQGNRFGVKLKATAPSLHMIKADITTEITPIIGTEKQCEELVQYMLREFEDNPQKIWKSEIFGKSVHDLVREGIQNKLHRMPENAQVKLQETLQRIVNEGSGGLICIII